MRVTSCVRFATFILAILLARAVSLDLGVMTEEADTGNAPAATPPLVSILKDTKSVRTQDFLLLHDLDVIAGGRDVYLQARTEWLEYFAMLRILDPLIDYAAARNNVPWENDDPVVPEVHDGVGGKYSSSPALPEWLLEYWRS